MIFEGVALTGDQVRAVEADPGRVAPLVHEGDGSRLSVDLDKAWHGIHFLLTGTEYDTSPPLGPAVLGGQPIGDDLGSGPARLLPADQVRTVADALAAVDQESLRRDFDPAAFESHAVYPTGIWAEEDVLETYLLPNLRALTEFYAAAAAADRAVLLVIG